MTKAYREFDPVNYLKTEEHVSGYLAACVDEDPGDGSLVRAALGDIARAQNMKRLAESAGLDRAGLYRALSEGANPSFATIFKLAKALGLRLRLEPKESTRLVTLVDGGSSPPGSSPKKGRVWR